MADAGQSVSQVSELLKLKQVFEKNPERPWNKQLGQIPVVFSWLAHASLL